MFCLSSVAVEGVVFETVLSVTLLAGLFVLRTASVCVCFDSFKLNADLGPLVLCNNQYATLKMISSATDGNTNSEALPKETPFRVFCFCCKTFSMYFSFRESRDSEYFVSRAGAI